MEQNQNNGETSGSRMDFSHAARILLLLGASFLLMGQEAVLLRLERGGKPALAEERAKDPDQAS